MTVKTLTNLKNDLLKLQKETADEIEEMAHEYASTMVMKEFGFSDLTDAETEEKVAWLLAYGTITNKTMKAIKEEIENIEKAIKILTKEEGEE